LGGATLVSLIFSWVSAAAAFAVLGVVAAGVAIWQLSLFTRRLHGLVEVVADECELIPADPVARAALPVGPPRTA